MPVDRKGSALDLAETLTGDERLIGVQDGTSVGVPVSAIAGHVQDEILAVLSLNRTAIGAATPEASGTTLTLPWPVAASEMLQLRRNGVEQWEGADFTISGTALTIIGGYEAGEAFTYRKLSLGVIA